MFQESDLILDSFEQLIDLANEEEKTDLRLFKEATKAPNWMANNARKGLKIRESLPKSKQCCTQTGLIRANQLEKQENLSLETLKRMKSFAARHGAKLTKEDESGKTKRGQAMLIWGIKPTKAGLDRFNSWLDREINKIEQS